MKTFLLFVTLQLLIVNIYAQKEFKYHIKLTTNSGISKIRKELEIDLNRIENKLVISYVVLDSVRTIEYLNDPEHTRLTEELLKIDYSNKNSDSTIHKDIRKLFLKYAIYYKDTLVLSYSDNPQLFDFIDLFVKKDADFIAEMRPRDEYILDGSWFLISIVDQTNTNTKYYIHCLDKTRYPLSYKLVSSLFDAYRKLHPGTLLDSRTKTMNY